MTGETQVRRRLRLHPSSVGRARRLVRDALKDAGREDLHDGAQLLVTELVTNALLHAGTYLWLSFSASAEGIVVLVSDGSPTQPVLCHSQPADADSGRGLLLVDKLSDAWGVFPTGPGKTVWFQLDSAPEAAPQQ